MYNSFKEQHRGINSSDIYIRCWLDKKFINNEYEIDTAHCIGGLYVRVRWGYYLLDIVSIVYIEVNLIFTNSPTKTVGIISQKPNRRYYTHIINIWFDVSTQNPIHISRPSSIDHRRTTLPIKNVYTIKLQFNICSRKICLHICFFSFFSTARIVRLFVHVRWAQSTVLPSQGPSGRNKTEPGI